MTLLAKLGCTGRSSHAYDCACTSKLHRHNVCTTGSENGPAFNGAALEVNFRTDRKD
jgi:hypothetical protein